MNLGIDVLVGIGVTAGITAAEGQIGPIEQYMGLIEKFGVMACLLIYFLIRDWLQRKADVKEKEGLISKINSLDTFIRDSLLKQLTTCNNIIRDDLKTHGALLKAIEKEEPLSRAAHDRRIERAQDPSLSTSQSGGP